MTSNFQVQGANIERSYGAGPTSVHVLRGVSLEIADAEMVVIQGRSGSGKTTLLNIIGGLDRPDSGSLNVCGHELVDMDDAGLAELRRTSVAFVFQAFGLLPVLSAAENVEVPLRLKKVGRAERTRRVATALDAVGLSGRARHRPGELSGGEQQRVAIARAMVAEPKLLIADEPTGQLDAATGKRIISLLQELSAERGLAMLIATHDPDIASRSNRALRLHDGSIQA